MIKRVHDRLIRESADEVRWGRKPISPVCLPQFAYRATATWGASRGESEGLANVAANTLPQGGVQDVYTPDNRHRFLILAVNTRNPRVALLEFESGGLVDRQRPIDGWVTLVLVVRAVGIPGDVVPGVLTARAVDGSMVARVDPNKGRVPDPCLPPFERAT